MNCKNYTNQPYKIIEKIETELREIQMLSVEYMVKERISKLIDYIEDETTNNKTIFAEMIYCKVKATKGIYLQLNADFYLLYRNFMEDKIEMEEAKRLYEMYSNELNAML